MINLKSDKNQPDLFSSLSSVIDWNGGTTSYGYDAAGRLTKTLRPNNTARKQVYDAAGQLRFIEERDPANTLLWMRAFEYDADGRITETYTWPSNTQSGYTAPNASDSASYDADNRIGQWRSGNGESINVEFDDDGNMTHGPAVNNPNSAGVSYQYDAHNRLTGVGGTPLYRYNPEGHLVEASGVRYVIDPNAALSRTLMRKQGDTTTYYIWGAAGLEYEITGTATSTYHADHLGSTMLLTDSSGQPAGYFEYDSYGTQTHGPTTSTTPFRWHGTLGVTTDPGGLVHMRARFYHPRLMRFLNQDPIGFEGGMNWFAAFYNNPLSNVDPTGLVTIFVHGTWSSGAEAFPNDFRQTVRQHFGDTNEIIFNWPGNNNDSVRRQAGANLAQLINNHLQQNPNDPINVVAHSHGGNVGLVASAAAPIDTLVTLGTPILTAYQRGDNLNNWVNVFSTGDRVQTLPWRAQRESANADANIRLTNFGHSALHTVGAWNAAFPPNPNTTNSTSMISINLLTNSTLSSGRK